MCLQLWLPVQLLVATTNLYKVAVALPDGAPQCYVVSQIGAAVWCLHWVHNNAANAARVAVVKGVKDVRIEKQAGPKTGKVDKLPTWAVECLPQHSKDSQPHICAPDP